MKKLALLAGVAALAACSEAAPEAEAAPETVEVAETAVGGPGTYEVTYGDGTVVTMTSTEDGKFSSVNGDQTATGTVAQVDGKACFDADGDEEGAMCWTAGETAPDGSWVATSDAGETVTVKPVA